MHKTIFMLTLVSFVAQPLQSMSKSRTTSYHIPSQTQQPIDQEKLILGGALAAGAALVYWLYRSSYKSSLKEAHASLEAMQKQFGDISGRYDGSHNPGADKFDAIHCHEAATPLYRAIERDNEALRTIVSETRKHKTAWDGYQDYHHSQAQQLIMTVQTLQKSLENLTKELDHHVAQFVFSASITEEMAQLAMKYQPDNNPPSYITDLAEARAYQAELTSNTKKVADYVYDLTIYCTKYMTHPNNQVVRAQHLLGDARAIQKNMSAIQNSLTQRIAHLELNELYFATDLEFRHQIDMIPETSHPFASSLLEKLEKDIKGDLHKEQYPLLAYVAKVERARDNLRTKAAKNPMMAGSEHVCALADELDNLMRTVATMPVYDGQKANKQIADDASADRQHKERLAREEREAKERLAQKNRESQERIARQDREAKERTDEQIAENQRRIARAEEQKAIAARQKAEAEQQRVLLEAQRLKLEQQRIVREKLAGKPKASGNSQDDHLL